MSSQGIERDTTTQRKHLARARKIALKVIREKKAERESQALRIAHDTVNSLKILDKGIGASLLAMLYWAEGGKQIGNMKFTNTDPELVFTFLSLLRRNYPINEEKLHIALQIHSYHEEKKVIEFWSEKLQIPKTQFWKIYIKPRSGKRREYRRNFYGICNVHYSSTAIQRELLAIGKILSEKLTEQLHQ